MANWKDIIFARRKGWKTGSAGAFAGSAAPLSGVAPYGTFAGFAGPGSTYQALSTGVEYTNEGTQASPYWTPTNHANGRLFGAFNDFRDGVGKAHADTAAGVTLVGTGLRIFGQGIAETDSGVVVTHGEGGPVARITTTDEDAHLIALGYGGTTVPFQPDTHGPLVVDVEIAMVTALTLRRLFVGFVGTAADALDPPVTSTTLTHTLVQDDLAGIVYDAAMTDAGGLWAVHNKSDEAATLASTATGCDTGVDISAFGTYQRLRVEISRAGVMTCFKDKVQIARVAASLDVDEEVAAVVSLGSTSAAVKIADVKRFSCWGTRA
jgi:hypothetical protein